VRAAQLLSYQRLLLNSNGLGGGFALTSSQPFGSSWLLGADLP
jgi:hypothetical protein